MGSSHERTEPERAGFGFERAALIFRRPVIEWCDIRKDWGEPRIVAVGVVEGDIFAVILPIVGRFAVSSPHAKPARRNASYGTGP
jgi:hypothetical protein